MLAQNTWRRTVLAQRSEKSRYLRCLGRSDSLEDRDSLPQIGKCAVRVASEYFTAARPFEGSCFLERGVDLARDAEGLLEEDECLLGVGGLNEECAGAVVNFRLSQTTAEVLVDGDGFLVEFRRVRRVAGLPLEVTEVIEGVGKRRVQVETFIDVHRLPNVCGAALKVSAQAGDPPKVVAGVSLTESVAEAPIGGQGSFVELSGSVKIAG